MKVIISYTNKRKCLKCRRKVKLNEHVTIVWSRGERFLHYPNCEHPASGRLPDSKTSVYEVKE